MISARQYRPPVVAAQDPLTEQNDTEYSALSKDTSEACGFQNHDQTVFHSAVNGSMDPIWFGGSPSRYTYPLHLAIHDPNTQLSLSSHLESKPVNLAKNSQEMESEYFTESGISQQYYCCNQLQQPLRIAPVQDEIPELEYSFVSDSTLLRDDEASPYVSFQQASQNFAPGCETVFELPLPEEVAMGYQQYSENLERLGSPIRLNEPHELPERPFHQSYPIQYPRQRMPGFLADNAANRTHKLNQGLPYDMMSLQSAAHEPSRLVPQPSIVSPCDLNEPARVVTPALTATSSVPSPWLPETPRNISTFGLKKTRKVPQKRVTVKCPSAKCKPILLSEAVKSDEPDNCISVLEQIVANPYAWQQILRGPCGQRRCQIIGCNVIYENVVDLVTHLSTHVKAKLRDHRCPDQRCLYYIIGFQTIGQLSRHIRSKHRRTAQKEHQCSACAKAFPRLDSLKRHLEACRRYKSQRFEILKNSKLTSTQVCDQLRRKDILEARSLILCMRNRIPCPDHSMYRIHCC